jgi:signal peptidase II
MVDPWLSGAAVLVADQCAKRWAAKTAPFDHAVGSSGPRLVHMLHRRPSHVRRGGRALLIATWVAALAAAAAASRLGWFESGGAQHGFALALGGATGNLLDILRFHGVVDVVDLRWWPVFNLADVAIVVGLLLFTMSW